MNAMGNLYVVAAIVLLAAGCGAEAPDAPDEPEEPSNVKFCEWPLSTSATAPELPAGSECFAVSVDFSKAAVQVRMPRGNRPIPAPMSSDVNACGYAGLLGVLPGDVVEVWGEGRLTFEPSTRCH